MIVKISRIYLSGPHGHSLILMIDLGGNFFGENILVICQQN